MQLFSEMLTKNWESVGVGTPCNENCCIHPWTANNFGVFLLKIRPAIKNSLFSVLNTPKNQIQTLNNQWHQWKQDEACVCTYPLAWRWNRWRSKQISTIHTHRKHKQVLFSQTCEISPFEVTVPPVRHSNVLFTEWINHLVCCCVQYELRRMGTQYQPKTVLREIKCDQL